MYLVKHHNLMCFMVVHYLLCETFQHKYTVNKYFFFPHATHDQQNVFCFRLLLLLCRSSATFVEMRCLHGDNPPPKNKIHVGPINHLSVS